MQVLRTIEATTYVALSAALGTISFIFLLVTLVIGVPMLLGPILGPILGGWLVDSFSWRWIFFINIPVGIIGFVLVWRLVPSLPTHSHKFDWLGVALSGTGMFLLVFGIQEGHQYDWGTITGIITVTIRTARLRRMCSTSLRNTAWNELIMVVPPWPARSASRTRPRATARRR